MNDIQLTVVDQLTQVVKKLSFSQNEISIGKLEGCDIMFDTPKVSRHHAKIEFKDGVCALTDFGSTNGTFHNGQRVSAPVALMPLDNIGIANYLIQVTSLNLVKPAPASHQKPKHEDTKIVHTQRREDPATIHSPKHEDPTTALRHKSPAPKRKESEIDLFYKGLSGEQKKEYTSVKLEIHRRLLEILDLRRMDVGKIPEAELKLKTEDGLKKIIIQMRPGFPSFINEAVVLKEIIDEALGLGPLEDLLSDESISEIMVNRNDQIYIERGGLLEISPKSFSSDVAVRNVIERIVAPLGRRIDESSPLVDARLKDGSRVNAIIHPLALKGPSLTIRKFSKKPLTVEKLATFGSISTEMGDFLKLAVESRQNIIVSGGTGSGKTTLLNVISGFIPSGERIVTIEDSAELQLPQEHVVSLESRPPNIEGKGAITIRDLVKNSLRMRPDRIVVGECRGGEALDMLQAMNTGHDGSMTTGHANTPSDMISRLETMVLMSGMDLPVRAIRDQIAGAINLIVQLTRFGCGSRKVTFISEVIGIEEGEIVLQHIFYYRQTGFSDDNRVKGYYVSTGHIPHFMEEMATRGIEINLSMFKNH